MKPLPSPALLKQRHPSRPEEIAFVNESRCTIRDILKGIDPRLLLIVGPCSIHDLASAEEYAFRLKNLNREVSSQFFILMRTYFEKPRTLTGWKGLAYDPALDGSHDVETGLSCSRQLLIDLARMKVPTATEFLDPLVRPYIEDLICWGSIGARTATSPIHRQMASALPMPVGIKNPITGTLDAAIQGVVAATKPHTLFGLTDEGTAAIVRAQGNHDAHLVLRGWDCQPNYDPFCVNHALDSLRRLGLPPRLLIDCSHDNSNKKYDRQATVFQNIIDQALAGNRSIRGLLLESHLHAGNQALSPPLHTLTYGLSVTDPCLGWEETERLILSEAERLETSIGIKQLVVER
jgi:3-deoxy-7-phosphoheptulonate synthase